MRMVSKIIKSKKHYLFKIAFCLMILLGIIMIIFSNTNEKAQVNSHDISHYIFGISSCGMLLCFFFVVIYGVVVKGYSVIGSISFSDSGITTEINNISEEISIVDIKSCQFKIKGFDGESPIMRSSSCFKGNYNYVTIKTEKGDYFFEFYLANFPTIRSLYIFIIADWRNKGVNVEFNYPNHKFDA